MSFPFDCAGDITSKLVNTVHYFLIVVTDWLGSIIEGPNGCCLPQKRRAFKIQAHSMLDWLGFWLKPHYLLFFSSKYYNFIVSFRNNPSPLLSNLLNQIASIPLKDLYSVNCKCCFCFLRVIEALNMLRLQPSNSPPYNGSRP